MSREHHATAVSLERFPDAPHSEELWGWSRRRGLLSWQEQDRKIVILKTTSWAGSGQHGSTRQHPASRVERQSREGLFEHMASPKKCDGEVTGWSRSRCGMPHQFPHHVQPKGVPNPHLAPSWFASILDCA